MLEPRKTNTHPSPVIEIVNQPKNVPLDIQEVVGWAWGEGRKNPFSDMEQAALRYFLHYLGKRRTIAQVYSYMYEGSNYDPSDADQYRKAYRPLCRLKDKLHKYNLERPDLDPVSEHYLEMILPRGFGQAHSPAANDDGHGFGLFLYRRALRSREWQVVSDSQNLGSVSEERWGPWKVSRNRIDPTSNEIGAKLDIALKWAATGSDERLALPIDQINLYYDLSVGYSYPDRLMLHKEELWGRFVNTRPNSDLHEGSLYRIDADAPGIDPIYGNPWEDTHGLCFLGRRVLYTDYATTNMSLGTLCRTEAGEELPVWDLMGAAGRQEALAKSANPLALNLMLILKQSSNNLFVINLRGPKNRENPDSFGPSLSGTLNPDPETGYLLQSLAESELQSIQNNIGTASLETLRKIDLRRMISDMAEAELGSQVRLALEDAPIEFHAYGRGLKFGTSALMGMAMLDLTPEQVVESWRLHSNKHETKDVIFLPFDFESVQEFFDLRWPSDLSNVKDPARLRRLPFLELAIAMCFRAAGYEL